MNSLMYALIVVLSINLILWSSNEAIIKMNPNAAIYDKSGVLENFNVTNSDPYGELPQNTGKSGISAEGGNIFIDSISTFLSWLSEKSGFNTFIMTLKAPYNFAMVFFGQSADGQQFAVMVAGFWYLITFGLIILVLLGRSF